MIYHCKHCGPGSLTIPGGDVCFDCYTQAHLAQQADGETDLRELVLATLGKAHYEVEVARLLPPRPAGDAGAEQVLAAYDDARDRLGFYQREVNRTEGNGFAVDRAEKAQRVLAEARTALLNHLAAARQAREEGDEAEPTGLYTVGRYQHYASPEGRDWAVEGPWSPSDTTFTEAEAKAIANALNRLQADRAALLDIKTTEGLSASEWMMRTATAEAEVARLEEATTETVEWVVDNLHEFERSDGTYDIDRFWSAFVKREGA